jgi:DNA-binding Lrp family transcriptional regulator
MKMIYENISEETLTAKTYLRDQVELLSKRVYLLDGKDRALLKMCLENGSSFRQIALLIGINETSIARRVHKLIKRLTTGKYITCLQNREKFTEFQMGIAKDYFLNGLSLKNTAQKHCLSYYRTREIISVINKILEAIE